MIVADIERRHAAQAAADAIVAQEEGAALRLLGTNDGGRDLKDPTSWTWGGDNPWSETGQWAYHDIELDTARAVTLVATITATLRRVPGDPQSPCALGKFTHEPQLRWAIIDTLTGKQWSVLASGLLQSPGGAGLAHHTERITAPMGIHLNLALGTEHVHSTPMPSESAGMPSAARCEPGRCPPLADLGAADIRVDLLVRGF